MLIYFIAVFSTLSGLVVHRVGRYRECILFGWLAWAIGLGLFSTLDTSSGIGKQVGYGILTGVGVGNTLQPLVSTLKSSYIRTIRAIMLTWLFQQGFGCYSSRCSQEGYGSCDVVPQVGFFWHPYSRTMQLTNAQLSSFVRNLGATLGLAVSGTIL